MAGTETVDPIQAVAAALFDAGIPTPKQHYFNEWYDQETQEGVESLIHLLARNGFVIASAVDLTESLDVQEFMVLNHMTSPEHEDAYRRLRALVSEPDPVTVS